MKNTREGADWQQLHFPCLQLTSEGEKTHPRWEETRRKSRATEQGPYKNAFSWRDWREAAVVWC